MAQMQVFVSHSHQDTVVCQAIVQALRDAGADVWFDESDLGAGHVRRVIMQELVRRPVFVVVLSKAAFASQWVMDECDWAYDLQKDEPNRILLPVVIEPLGRADFNTALHLYGLKRIEAPGMQPYPTEDAVRWLLHMLALTPVGEASAPTAPQLQESVDDLMECGKALMAQQRYADAIPLFERATQLDPRSSDAWAILGAVLYEEWRWVEALAAYERALTLDANQAWVWSNKGIALNVLQRYEEALGALDRALALDSNLATAWNSKAIALSHLKRKKESLVASDRALALGETSMWWRNKATTLRALRRTAEAEAAERRAKELGG